MKKSTLFLCTLIVLALIAGFLSASAQADGTQYSSDEVEALLIQLEDDSKELPVDEQFRVQVDEGDLSMVNGLDGNWTNILLLGTDSWDLRLNYGRTDAMIVLSINSTTGQIKLTSLVRDMLIDIPNTRFKNRINTANAFGGPLLAVKAVNQVLGANIRHYCSINFKGFERVVDDLGGVTLTLSSGEAADAGVRQTKEPQLLNGEQALRYVRIRRLDNNFGRNERQRKLLAAMFDQMKTKELKDVMSAVTIAFQSIATNLSVSDVFAFLPLALENADGLDTLSLPRDGEYQYQTTDAGASVVVFDQEQTKQAFHDFVYGN